MQIASQEARRHAFDTQDDISVGFWAECVIRGLGMLGSDSLILGIRRVVGRQRTR